MTTILFGAGASYGSGEVLPYPPPLGNNLFSDLKKKYPSVWGAFPNDVEEMFKNNFEHGMELVKNTFALTPLMQTMAVYFSEFFFNQNSDNLYLNLIKAIQARKKSSSVCLSTLNYECLLELACDKTGLDFTYEDEPDKLSLMKLHGSCNFAIKGLSMRGMKIQGYTIHAGIRFLGVHQVRNEFLNDNSLYPSMCLYAKDKPVFNAPNSIRQIQKNWQDKISLSRRIIIIGVRPNPEDSHLWNPIQASSGKVYYVGDKSLFDNWCELFRPGKQNLFLGNRWNQVEKDVEDLI